MVMITDNRILVERFVETLPLFCIQRKAEKRISSEDDFVQSNIDSFGSTIGQVTNYVTSMYDVQSRFDKGSVEYKTLEYRIQCGQHFQQNSINSRCLYPVMDIENMVNL